MKQKNFIVETYINGDDQTFIVREPADNNQWQAKLITSNCVELADFFGAL